MKAITFFTILIVLTFAISGCGAGGDPVFSPDPSIGDEAGGGGEENPEGGEDEIGDGSGEGGDGGGGEAVVEEKEDENEEENDCFLEGFCYRECIAASDCPDGFSCIMHVCTFDCQSDEECGNGGVCSDVGLCEVGEGKGIPACIADTDCGEGRFCNDVAECEQIPILLGCQGDTDCPLGQYCDDVHKCELLPGAGVECGADDDCPGDYYCDEAGECQQDCRSDYQCANGEACDGKGRCVVSGAPAKLLKFNFNALGADTDPQGPVAFESANFKIGNAVITPAGRNEILTSTNYRLIGSAEF